ncbi:MAG TPA: PEP-CTERM sorting domain-containing protein [Bryobacteraceae bacterium]
MKNSFTGRFLFVVVLLVAFSGIGFAAACVPGSLIVGPATLSGGTILTSTFSCTEGAYTFSNFEVLGNTVPTPVPDFSVSTGPSTSASAYLLGLGYTDITGTGADFFLEYTITPGVVSASLSAGPGVFVAELLCGTPTSGTCSTGILNTTVLATSNGGSVSSNVILAGTDYVFKDIAGGSNVVQDFVPEPVTFSLMGFGLLALGFAGRKRIRKD